MKMQKKRSPAAAALSVSSVLLAAAACVLLILILRGKSGARSYEECLELGQKYLEEMNYDEAILMFQDAVNIEPKRTEAYTELVSLYIERGEYDKAREVLDYAEAKVDEEGREKLSVQPALALIDGNRDRGIAVEARCVIGGDGKCADIAAASILAKVTRDRYMLQLAQQYPQYGFEKHKGYGTAAHYAAIRTFGPSPVHRMSFLRKMH